MNVAIKLNRPQSMREEIANSISHGMGALAAIVITPILILKAAHSGTYAVVGVSIFGATMILLYLASTLYHAFQSTHRKRIFMIFDHSAIFLLIAGTYTAFTLMVLPDLWGWTLFVIIWTLAAGGVVSTVVRNVKIGNLTIAVYLGMGWLVVMAVKPFYHNLPVGSLIWLIIGGAMYSVGVIFFAYDHRVRYNHFIWHLFVLAGTTCHVAAVLSYTV